MRRRRFDEDVVDPPEDMREDVRLGRLLVFHTRTQLWRVVAVGPAWSLFEIAASRSAPLRVVAVEDGTILYASPGDRP